MEKNEKSLISADYHGDTTRISKSGLDKIAKSPAHYFSAYLDPATKQGKTTKALDIGDLFHTAVLEPHKFFQRYIIPPTHFDRRTTEGKAGYNAFLEVAGDRKFINREMYDVAMRMADSLMKNRIAQNLFASGIAERTCLFTEPETGALCKCRPDWETSDLWLVDLKTSEDASPYAFRRSVKNYRYFVQTPFYMDGIFYERGTMPNGFIFVAVEKTPPYAVGLYYLDDEDIRIGRETYLNDLATYQQCKSTGVWPGYSPRIERLKIF
jgi:exodeoxyribonuclease VIII